MAISKIPSAGFQDNVKFRNIIINGDMSIAQRSTSVASISSGSAYNTIDRMRFGVSGLGTWTQSQSTDVPTGQGFAKSFKLDCTTADASPGASDYIFLNYNIEGQDLQYLKKGTANAESLTLSFWVKSNKTGTYTFELDDNDNNRSISKTYTVDSANTWEKKTITIEDDTTGTLDNDNNNSLRFYFWLGAGSNYTSGTLQTSWQSTTDANRVSSSNVNLGDSTSNEWYITGVQLEAGTTASDFEFLPHDVNLGRCLRYYELLATGTDNAFGIGVYYSSAVVYYSNNYKITKRAIPSLDQVTGTDRYAILRNGAADFFSGFTGTTSKVTDKFFEVYVSTNISGTGGQAGFLRTNHNNCLIGFDAEL